MKYNYKFFNISLMYSGLTRNRRRRIKGDETIRVERSRLKIVKSNETKMKNLRAERSTQRLK